MLLIIAIVLFLLFGGLGFILHVLWLGLLVALVVGAFHVLTGNRRS